MTDPRHTTAFPVGGQVFHTDVPRPFPHAINHDEISSWCFYFAAVFYAQNCASLHQHYPDIEKFTPDMIPRSWVVGLAWSAN